MVRFMAHQAHLYLKPIRIKKNEKRVTRVTFFSSPALSELKSKLKIQLNEKEIEPRLT